MSRNPASLRIFLSSTFEDLVEHRRSVDLALQRMLFSTSRMEIFGARPHAPLAECCKLAAEADAVVVMVAHRYGWVPTAAQGGDGKKSITWHEVEAAVAAGKPIFAFVVDEKARWAGRREQDRLTEAKSHEDFIEIGLAVRELGNFKTFLGQWQRDTFDTPDDLAMKVSTSLGRWLVEERGIEVTALDAYLRDLIDETEHFKIQGLAQRGRGRDALRPRIENLYTPLHCRDSSHFGGGRMELSKILPRSRRILIEGQPGAGKSTFLRLVACLLARDTLGLTCGGGSWRSRFLGLDDGEPAPLPILLRLAAFVAFFEKNPGRPDDRERLLDLLEERNLERKLGFERAFWRQKLEQGGALLLLDGLDEVADLDCRERIFRIFADAENSWKANMVVASRPFRTDELRARGFLLTAVEPFSQEDIERFLFAWVAVLYEEKNEKALGGEARKYSDSLAKAILNRPAVRQLAANPVMLTSLCVVHYNDGELPEARALVDWSVIHWLLRSREEQRQAALGLGAEFAFRTFAQLALALMESGKKAVFELSEAAALAAPAFERERPGLTAKKRQTEAERWLLFECENSGVVEELPGRKLRFWHLGFAEFLAARELAQDEAWWKRIEQHLDDPQWGEALELFATCLYHLGGSERADKLLEAVLQGGQGGELPAVARAVGLFGRFLPAIEVCGYKPAPELRRHFEALRDRVMAIFELEGAAKVPVKVRIAAAEALGRAGDPRLRPEVDNFLPVPGTTPGLLLGRFPVTVQEFQRFVDGRAYEESRFWDAEGWKMREKEGWEAPRDWEKQVRFPNRPVVGVSWFEAVAYCHWLKDLSRRPIRLPTEAEWQKAATSAQGEYPWGEPEPTAEHANYGNLVGSASPVGIYPLGAGRWQHLDLAGNVWEWCSDVQPEENGEAVRPLRGGGCWHDAGSLRSAFRGGYWPRGRYDDFGFRVAVSPASLGP